MSIANRWNIDQVDFRSDYMTQGSPFTFSWLEVKLDAYHPEYLMCYSSIANFGILVSQNGGYDNLF